VIVSPLHPATAVQAGDLFHAMDYDGDGRLSYDEWTDFTTVSTDAWLLSAGLPYSPSPHPPLPPRSCCAWVGWRRKLPLRM